MSWGKDLCPGCAPAVGWPLGGEKAAANYYRPNSVCPVRNYSAPVVPASEIFLTDRERTDLTTDTESVPIYVDRIRVRSNETSVTDLAVIYPINKYKNLSVYKTV